MQFRLLLIRTHFERMNGACHPLGGVSNSRKTLGGKFFNSFTRHTIRGSETHVL